MNIKNLIVLVLITLSLSSCSRNYEVDLEVYFNEFDIEGCFVLYDLKKDQFQIYNKERATTRYFPASTYKILNTIVALETGVAKDRNFFLKWDGVSGVIPSHKQDHTLGLAFKNSTLWFYQEIARRVGLEQMQEIVSKADFVNKQIGSQVDQFWLEGPLKISAIEYIEFLKNLYLESLPFSKTTFKEAKNIYITEQTQNYTLRSKTGTTVVDGEQLSWYVGYIEKKDNVYFFAMNVSSPRPDNFLYGKAVKARIPLTRKILSEMQIIPE
jgi:beta-lactamase class D